MFLKQFTIADFDFVALVSFDPSDKSATSTLESCPVKLEFSYFSRGSDINNNRKVYNDAKTDRTTYEPAYLVLRALVRHKFAENNKAVRYLQDHEFIEALLYISHSVLKRHSHPGVRCPSKNEVQYQKGLSKPLLKKDEKDHCEYQPLDHKNWRVAKSYCRILIQILVRGFVLRFKVFLVQIWLVLQNEDPVCYRQDNQDQNDSCRYDRTSSFYPRMELGGSQFECLYASLIQVGL